MDISSRAVVHAHCHDSPTDIWASSRFLNLSLDRNFTSLLLLTWVSQKIFRSKWHSPVWYLHCMYHALQMALLRRILSLHWSFKPLKFFHFGDTSFPLKQNRKQNHSDFFFFFFVAAPIEQSVPLKLPNYQQKEVQAATLGQWQLLPHCPRLTPDWSPLFKTSSHSYLPANNCHNRSCKHFSITTHFTQIFLLASIPPIFSSASLGVSLTWEQEFSQLSPKPCRFGCTVGLPGLDFAKELDEVNISSFLQFYLIF